MKFFLSRCKTLVSKAILHFISAICEKRIVPDMCTLLEGVSKKCLCSQKEITECIGTQLTLPMRVCFMYPHRHHIRKRQGMQNQCGKHLRMEFETCSCFDPPSQVLYIITFPSSLPHPSVQQHSKKEDSKAGGHSSEHWEFACFLHKLLP